MAEEQAEVAAKHKRMPGASDDVCTKKPRRLRGLEMLPNSIIFEIFILANRPTVLRLLNRNWEQAVRFNPTLWEQLLSCMRVDKCFLQSTVWINNSDKGQVRIRRSWYIFLFAEDHGISVSHEPFYLQQINSEEKVQKKLDNMFPRIYGVVGMPEPFERIDHLPRKDWFVVEETSPGLLVRTERKSSMVYIGRNPTFHGPFWNRQTSDYEEDDSDTNDIDPRLYVGEDQGFRSEYRGYEPKLCKSLSAYRFPRFTPFLYGGEGLGEADVLTFVGRWSEREGSKSPEMWPENKVESDEGAESESEEEGVESESGTGAECEEGGQGI